MPLKGHYGLSREHCFGQQSRSPLTVVPAGPSLPTHAHTQLGLADSQATHMEVPQILGHGVAFGSALSPQDVAALQYRAPRLAVDCLTQALPGPPHTTLILDVACGTGLVAAEVSEALPDTLPNLQCPHPHPLKFPATPGPRTLLLPSDPLVPNS